MKIWWDWGILLGSGVCGWAEIRKKIFYVDFYAELHPVSTALDLNNVLYPLCKKVKLHLLGWAEQRSPPSPRQPLTGSTSSHLWHVSPESIRKLQGGICILTMLTAKARTFDSSDIRVRTSACLLLTHVWPTKLGELAVVYARLDWSHMRARILTVYFEID